MIAFDAYREIWVVDFEFIANAGERPIPVCLVALEVRTGHTIRMWQDDLRRSSCPYATDHAALFVAYFASAELGCHRVLGWPDPVHILDPFVEFSNLANGRSLPYDRSLLGAALTYRLGGAMTATEKERGRALVLRGAPWTNAEKTEILDYCQGDVELTARLLQAMRPALEPRALLRGQFMAAVAAMEHHGIPIDRDTLTSLRTHWSAIRTKLIDRVDRAYGCFEGETFKRDQFETWLVRAGIPWPRLLSGQLDLSDDTFRQMAKSYQQVAPLRELRHALSALRLNELAVGADDRNRTLLSPFRACTSRCAPSNSKYIFGPSVWLRHLIRPTPGFALAYVDYCQQEFAIAAAFSADERMMNAYRSGDPYLDFAKQAGAVPADATKASHGPTRELYKIASLAVLYGMGPITLAARLGRSESEARDLLQKHRETFPTFWKWIARVLDYAMLSNHLFTTFGWQLHVGPTTTTRTLQNFPAQANAAEILRLACIFALRRGIKVCAPIHDAVLIEAPRDRIDNAVAITRQAMREAGEVVLSGFPLTTEAHIFRSPARYHDGRGRRMWVEVQGILQELRSHDRVHSRRSAARRVDASRLRGAAHVATAIP